MFRFDESMRKLDITSGDFLRLSLLILHFGCTMMHCNDALYALSEASLALPHLRNVTLILMIFDVSWTLAVCRSGDQYSIYIYIYVSIVSIYNSSNNSLKLFITT